MANETGVLLTKLTPPMLDMNLVERPHLLSRLDKISAKVVILQAATGYGKTTLLASYIQKKKQAICWYRVTELDQDEKSYWLHLIYAIRQQVPQFGEGLEEHFSDQEQFLQMLINQIYCVSDPLTILIDDFHHIGDHNYFRQQIPLFISLLPPHIRLVIATRHDPKWSGLTMMKLKGELLLLEAADLAWSKQEIAQWVTMIGGPLLVEEQLQEMMDVTQGWGIAVRLATTYLLQGKGIEEIVQPHSAYYRDLYQYLEEEVWQQQSVSIQDIQEKMSFQREWSLDCFSELFGVQVDEVLLKQLESLKPFVHIDDYQIIRFHPIYQHFIQWIFRKKREDYQQCQHRWFQYLLKHQRYEEAYQYLEGSRNEEELAQMIQVCGRDWIEKGELEKLEQALKRISKDVKNQFECLWIYEGDLNRYHSQYQQAMECYVNAEKIAKEKGDFLYQSLGLEGQAKIYLDTIQPGRAEYLLNKAIDLLQETKSNEEHLEKFHRLYAENLVNMGKVSDADQWLERHREVNSKFVDDELEARLFLRTGRLRRAKQMLERKYEWELLEKNILLPRSHREVELLLSLIDCFMGAPEEAKKLAEEGMMQGVIRRSPFVEACGWIRLGHAVQLIPKYERRLAAECYQTALEMMENLRMSRGKAEPLMGLSLLYGREGATDLANYYGQQAIAETEKVQDQWLSNLTRLGMAIASFYGDRLEEATHLFGECSQRFVQCGDSYFFTVSMLWQALTAYELEDELAFSSSMEQVLKLMQTEGYEYLLQKRTMFGPRDIQKWAQLLLMAQSRGIEEAYSSFLIHGMGFQNVSSHPGYTLRIQTLGDFRVWLGEEEVSSKDWQRGKAKELFQLLLTKRRMLLMKEEICSLLWPEADDKAATRDFKVALNALNNALEPKRPARSNSFYIQRQGSLYGFNLSSGYELDADEFERLIQIGLKEDNPIQLQSGLELYGGTYLPERRYEDWCFTERERYQSLFIRGAERLAQLYVREAKYDDAIYWCERMIQEDACWEEAYRLLMVCYYLKDNRPQAIRQYKKCIDILERELGVPPMPKTEQIYKQIVQGMFNVTHL
ncbi:BTAD domain-containing putative transcriptional regulator [Hazenella coriacea]|uniref:Transcriptional regulator n=1 Tax=Hazenella coriacea TaxID=1179467 RepID=A0A4R3L4L5_9BACL|nr:BTAD domain-containing putative transcriptional regulator [Hazenella coriacea]TCS93918.1 transcriptional regulator [Hazenella coriacea]